MIAVSTPRRNRAANSRLSTAPLVTIGSEICKFRLASSTTRAISAAETEGRHTFKQSGGWADSPGVEPSTFRLCTVRPGERVRPGPLQPDCAYTSTDRSIRGNVGASAASSSKKRGFAHAVHLYHPILTRQLQPASTICEKKRAHWRNASSLIPLLPR